MVDFCRFGRPRWLSEADYLLLCSKDLGYVPGSVLEPIAREIDELSRMLYRLRTKVEEEA